MSSEPAQEAFKFPLAPEQKPIAANIAEALASRLEDLVRTSASWNARVHMVAARDLLTDLRTICDGMPSLRDPLQRGRLAVQTLHIKYRVWITDRRSEHAELKRKRAEEIVERNAAFHRAEIQKKRIIRILQTAALSRNPSALTPHVRQCQDIWHGLGSAGAENLLLFFAYQEAARAF